MPIGIAEMEAPATGKAKGGRVTRPPARYPGQGGSEIVNLDHRQ